MPGYVSYLTDTLQYDYGSAEIANMKHWEFQVYVTKVTNAICQILTTCLTVVVFFTCALQENKNISANIE